MDAEIHAYHAKFSDEIDCLSCANCCRRLGPRITEKDIEKIAKSLRMKTSAVVEKYLRKDEDDDWVFRSMPCPFLGHDDNYCAIYAHRPKACREYPHTDRKRFYQLYHLSVKNAAVCPIVYRVLNAVSEKG
ncbi:MAG: YkgJ family cysteine cluster protein [Prevotellaceae bacterium]|nr:YkgJ family cysteine cluster protein [Prevotellaceae bacterium]